MANIWVQLPNDDRILLKVSPLTGSLKVIYDDKEVCKIGSRGGNAVFNIGDDKIEVEYKTSMLLGTQKVIVRFNDKKIYENRLLMGM